MADLWNLVQIYVALRLHIRDIKVLVTLELSDTRIVIVAVKPKWFAIWIIHSKPELFFLSLSLSPYVCFSHNLNILNLISVSGHVSEIDWKLIDNLA